MIATAALELSTNQVSHFYSEKKNTDEMIRLLELLISQYRGQTRIFLSWDAASWHVSKKFFGRVAEVNEPAYRAEHGTPAVEPAPLPFLNVIEAVFSGIERNRGNRWRFFREIRCNVEGDGPNNRRVGC